MQTIQKKMVSVNVVTTSEQHLHTLLVLFWPGRRESSPPRSFFYRVLRAAFPLQVLFLLLLILACLVPLTEEDYSCTLSNNFARSFYPMLRYTNGPPPT
ncbi:UNVERIFIED_CONTAM: hypothetical protein FKN15_072474 [Acipenser sinensis]